MTSSDPSKPKIVSRRRWPWLLAAAAVACLAAVGIWILLQTAIAPIVEDTVLEYAHRYGIKDMHLDVRQVTPWKADIQTFQVADPADKEQLRLDSLAVDYNPWGLTAHVIEGIKLSGLVLKLEKTSSGWNLAGLPPRLQTPAEKPGQDGRPLSRPDWRINRLEIRNSRLEIVSGRHQISVPFEFKAFPADKSGDRYHGQLVCQPLDQSVKADFEIDWARQRLVIPNAAADLDLQHLSHVLDAEATQPLKGRLKANGQARLALSPLTIEAAEVQLWLPEAVRRGNRMALSALNPQKPLATVKLAADRAWVLHAPGTVVAAPEHLRVLDWNGRLKPAHQGWQWEGAFSLGFDPMPSAPSTPEATPPAHTLPVTYEGQWQENGPWTFNLTGQGRRWEMDRFPARGPKAESGLLHFTPHLALAASGQKNQIQIKANARLDDLKGYFHQNTIRVPTVSFQAEGGGSWQQFQARYDVKADNLRARAKAFDARLARCSVAGAVTMANGRRQLSGKTRLSGGTVRMPNHQIRLEGIRLDLPLAWPHDPSTAGGRFHLGAATWNDLALGAVSGRIRQQADGADFRMTHHSALLPGGTLAIDGRLIIDPGRPVPRMDIDYRFDRPLSPDDIDLGKFAANLAGIQFNGRIEASGRGTYQDGQMQAGMAMKLAGGRLVLPEQKSGLVGLKGRLVLPDLLAMRSAPGQQLFFERAYLGDIAVTEGQIAFQIEPGRVFFLEQGRFQWCDGSVYLPATRVAPQNNDYDLTLWCDRLKLAPLLEQLGAAQAEGGGTVSGRIPVRIRQGQFRVDSGFLYSSPGEGGTIRLRGTELLTAGIAPGTPQYNQLELARQALKEYDYDWVKLSLATAPQEDLLRLKLQLNGRPAQPLPFIYDARAGGFVPAGPGSPGSRFEEIKLDVNFSLPLNRLLEYKDLLKLFS